MLKNEKDTFSCFIFVIDSDTFRMCNVSIGPGNFKFEKVHIDTYNYNGCLTIEKWYEDETGIEVKTKEVGAIYLSEGTYFLIEKECPFCAHQTEKGGESE